MVQQPNEWDHFSATFGGFTDTPNLQHPAAAGFFCYYFSKIPSGYDWIGFQMAFILVMISQHEPNVFCRDRPGFAGVFAPGPWLMGITMVFSQIHVMLTHGNPWESMIIHVFHDV